MLYENELVIDDSNYQDHIDYHVDGERCGKGLIPRNYDAHPVGCYASVRPFSAVDMPLIPKSEWSARIKEMEATKSRLSDIRMTGNNGQMIPSLDQGSFGFCWAHSSTSAVTVLRALQNLPFVQLSAFAVACMIKNFRDEGGWGAQSLDFISERGVPSAEFWPLQSMSPKNDNAQTWENAKLHRVTEGWIDLQAAQYDRKLSFDQVATCLLNRIPLVGDFNWWTHSVCLLDLVEVSRDSFGVRVWNSWGDIWGDNGMGVLSGSKAIPDGATAPRVVTASSN